MSQTTDIAIIGGGIVGSMTAYFLACERGFAGRVTVIERDPTYARASTTLSAASIRHQFSTPANIRLSMFGTQFLRDLKHRFGPDADVGFREDGYLLLATPDGIEGLRANHRTQCTEGADIALMGPTDLVRRFPWLRTVDLACGAFGRSGEGWFDAHGLLMLVRQAAKSAGVDYVQDEVIGLERDGNRLGMALLASGGRLAAGAFINAAGPQGGRIARMAGIALPVVPRKRTVFTLDCPVPLASMPLIVDPSGVWVRPEGNRFISGWSPGEDEPDPDADGDFDADYSLFEERIWPALAHRIPAMERLRMSGAWAGHYEVNTLDHNAVIGPHPELGNFYLANGFSGHGLQQAPAVGRALAEWLLDGASHSIDLAPFAYERISCGRPLREINVI